jgi:hypothetical protein
MHSTLITALFTAATGIEAADLMPAAQQTALVMRYCAVCHTDGARNGGLTLQHFDASNIDPSLAAMLVSKLRDGAMGASGITPPDRETTKALTVALAAESVGAHEWTITNQTELTASMLRESPTLTNAGNQPTMYRLVVSYNSATRQGDIQLSWAPKAANGTLLASLDEKAPVSYVVEGNESMGNGQGATDLRAATKLRLDLPAQTLVFSNLFPNQEVVFPFDTLPETARGTLNTCFNANAAPVPAVQ